MTTAGRVLLAILLLAASAAGGTVVELPSFGQLVVRADVIARVRVAAQRVEQDGDRLSTWTTLVVVEGLAGTTAGEQLLLYQPGGSLGARRTGVAGQPTHRLGDDVVLFLARARVRGRAVVIHRGLGYGVYDVTAGGALWQRAADVVRVPSAQGALPARFQSLSRLRDAVAAAQRAGSAGGAAP